MNIELSEKLDKIEQLIQKCLDTTIKVLSYYEQIAEQYERLRREHVSNHPNSPSVLPIQMIHRK
jgi:hypothetical protein